MNVYIVKINYTPREALGLRLSATVASMGVSAQDVARRWAYEHRDEVLADASVQHSVVVDQNGELVELDFS